jgi:hypothetical protein
MRKPLILCLLLLVSCISFAQRPKIKYGDVKPEDLKKTIYEIDSSANAVVLYDYCTVKYEGDSKADFNVIYKFHKRIKLLNKNSFDLATVSIPLSQYSQNEEKIEKLEAMTYNLENDKVVPTKIDKSSIFKDKVSKNYLIQKFTMPNLKEGSIVEYIYTISSPYSTNLRNWYFQGSTPVLWSEYDITVPAIFNFAIFKQGYHPFVIDTVSKSYDTYNILIPGSTSYERSETVSLKSDTYHSTWAMQDIPALRDESFTTTLRSHVAKIEFQISSLRYPERPERPVMRSWTQVAEDMLKNENFGADLSSKNGWMTDDIAKIIQGAATDHEKAKRIFEHVRDNFICNSHDAIYLSSGSIKKVYQAKAGNVADINLLLTAMLINKGFDAAPALLSTKDNGLANETYPLMDKFNYVICRLKIDSNTYLLDASEKIGFGKLPEQCYNGSARAIAAIPALIDVSPSSIVEGKVTSIFIINGEKGKIAGSLSSKLGYYESLSVRDRLNKSGKDEFFKNIKRSYSGEMDIEKGEVENEKNLDETATIKYDFKMPTNDEDIIYFNPLMGEAYKTNPFKSAQRYYPVEMPYPTNETIVFNMEVPEGYKVDELPKSVRVKYNEDEGKFEYIIAHNNGTIQMRCSIVLTKATYMPDEYDSLRSFFAYIVKKQGEQIVFKKIK